MIIFLKKFVFWSDFLISYDKMTFKLPSLDCSLEIHMIRGTGAIYQYTLLLCLQGFIAMLITLVFSQKRGIQSTWYHSLSNYCMIHKSLCTTWSCNHIYHNHKYHFHNLQMRSLWIFLKSDTSIYTEKTMLGVLVVKQRSESIISLDNFCSIFFPSSSKSIFGWLKFEFPWI